MMPPSPDLGERVERRFDVRGTDLHREIPLSANIRHDEYEMATPIAERVPDVNGNRTRAGQCKSKG